MRICSILLAGAMLAAPLAITGCDRTVSDSEHTSSGPNGTVKDSKTVTQSPNGDVNVQKEHQETSNNP